MAESLIARLYKAQNGICFHCPHAMIEACWSEVNHRGWTRDHVFPKAGSRGVQNNFVLAHRLCNVQKADRVPSESEIIRAIKLYEVLGYEAFKGGKLDFIMKKALEAAKIRLTSTHEECRKVG